VTRFRLLESSVVFDAPLQLSYKMTFVGFLNMMEMDWINPDDKVAAAAP
jgi:hypothetical protein